LGADLLEAGTARARRAVPPREHDGGLPGEDRAPRQMTLVPRTGVDAAGLSGPSDAGSLPTGTGQAPATGRSSGTGVCSVDWPGGLSRRSDARTSARTPGDVPSTFTPMSLASIIATPTPSVRARASATPPGSSGPILAWPSYGGIVPWVGPSIA